MKQPTNKPAINLDHNNSHSINIKIIDFTNKVIYKLKIIT